MIHSSYHCIKVDGFRVNFADFGNFYDFFCIKANVSRRYDKRDFTFKNAFLTFVNDNYLTPDFLTLKK